MRGIDLYAGIGGWAAGLKLAGINVVSSYERWAPACVTNSVNNEHAVEQVDIRKLDVNSLPVGIDVVVGSPPCTQFSFSNKGGKGDIEDGMLDIIKFLEIVDHVRPSYWVMENVPRLAKLLPLQFNVGGVLERFSHLAPQFYVMNADDFGLPQRRKRCLIGNIDFTLLDSYKSITLPRTLGDVVRALQSTETVVDPIYGISIHRSQLTDHRTDDHLSSEEARINATSKRRHLVYNAMAFPDDLDRPSRTITATCSHVSRESIVIPAETDGSYRRLSIRERASAQGFPINFQFLAEFYGQKLTMAGNAFPPLLAYYVGLAMQDTPQANVVPVSNRGGLIPTRNVLTKDVDPRQAKPRFPANRKFRYAIPSLQLKSGVRFELLNVFSADEVKWSVNFIFGTPRSIQSISLNDDDKSFHLIQSCEASSLSVHAILSNLRETVGALNASELQSVWSHRTKECPGPFELLDILSGFGTSVASEIHSENCPEDLRELIDAVLTEEFGDAGFRLPGAARLRRHAEIIVAGLLVGHAANEALQATGRLEQRLPISAGKNPTRLASLCRPSAA